MIVVDTNIIAFLLLPGEHAKAAEHLYEADRRWVAPLLWRSEFRSVLTTQLRRKSLGFEHACSLQKRAEKLLEGAEYEVDSDDVLMLVRDSDCSAYDCEFVALALQLESKLVTGDRQILRAYPGIALPFT